MEYSEPQGSSSGTTATVLRRGDHAEPEFHPTCTAHQFSSVGAAPSSRLLAPTSEASQPSETGPSAHVRSTPDLQLLPADRKPQR